MLDAPTVPVAPEVVAVAPPLGEDPPVPPVSAEVVVGPLDPVVVVVFPAEVVVVVDTAVVAVVPVLPPGVDVVVLVVVGLPLLPVGDVVVGTVPVLPVVPVVPVVVVVVVGVPVLPVAPVFAPAEVISNGVEKALLVVKALLKSGPTQSTHSVAVLSPQLMLLMMPLFPADVLSCSIWKAIGPKAPEASWLIGSG